MTPYEIVFPFIIEMAAHEVARGVRNLALLTISEEAWQAHWDCAALAAATCGVIIEWRYGCVVIAATKDVVEKYDRAAKLLDAHANNPAGRALLMRLLARAA